MAADVSKLLNFKQMPGNAYPPMQSMAVPPLNHNQWFGLRPSVFGQDRSETEKSVLVLHAAVLVLQVWCCVVKHDLVTLVVVMILKDTATFQVLFIVSLFCAWNITTVEINSGVHLLKS